MSEPRIVHEDSAILVAWKPPGMHTAPLREDDAGTLLGWVRERYPEVGTVQGRKRVEPGLLHRLDQDTRGLVLVARTDEAFELIMNAASRAAFRKRYSARCVPSTRLPPGASVLLPVPAPSAWIRTWFRPYGPRGSLVVVVADDMPGGKRRAVGPYETRVLSIDRDAGPPGIVLVRVELSRGFRHQVRVHLATSGFPIAGDRMYGISDDGWDELQLAADALSFPHPLTGEPFEVSIPDAWEDART